MSEFDTLGETAASSWRISGKVAVHRRSKVEANRNAKAKAAQNNARGVAFTVADENHRAGKVQRIDVNEVKFVPDLSTNLISVT